MQHPLGNMRHPVGALFVVVAFGIYVIVVMPIQLCARKYKIYARRKKVFPIGD